MAVLVKDPQRFVPADQAAKAEGEQIAYWLKPPTIVERTAFSRAVAERGGRRHGVLAMLGALRRGVADNLEEGDPRTNLLAQIDDAVEATRAFQGRLLAGDLNDGDAFRAAFAEQARLDESLAELSDTVAALDRRYARMIGDNAVYAEIAGAEAARLFLRGWEGIPAPFARDRAGVGDALLERIPPHHLPAIAGEVERLMAPTEAERKNSDSPSPSPSGATISTAANTPAPTSP